MFFLVPFPSITCGKGAWVLAVGTPTSMFVGQFDLFEPGHGALTERASRRTVTRGVAERR